MLKENWKSEIKCKKNSDVDAYLQIADAKKGIQVAMKQKILNCSLGR